MHSKKGQIHLDCFNDTDDLLLSLQDSREVAVQKSFVKFNELLEPSQFIFLVYCKHANVQVLKNSISTESFE